MDSTKSKKKWITLLVTAAMSFALLFGATACNDSKGGNGNIVVEDDAPDAVVPEGDAGADVESETPASPLAS